MYVGLWNVNRVTIELSMFCIRGDIIMVLCFAVLVKILLICSNQGIKQKVLCARMLSCINYKYGYELEADESTISKLMNCKLGLSPDEIVNVIQVIDFEELRNNVLANVVPLEQYYFLHKF